ncbi:MAG: L-seryl-tRNA(Sec) selenium transferase, partial [Dehalococcoidia bacterium]|nr:L-seryl-tRNA(Sec) selenium transferase [Dehalococcoidia bacterium]
DPRLKSITDGYDHLLFTKLVRGYIKEIRLFIKGGGDPPPFDSIVETIARRATAIQTPSMRKIINATGVILHTNLGRSSVSRETVEAMTVANNNYVNLEIDINRNQRGSRQDHLRSLLKEITGAESAMVVNNNASAVLLALSALVKGKEVIVSRGQSVEIGGGFRVPEVMRQSGARLIDVGTTNITYKTDYEAAITPSTAALLRVHSSNFRVIGFTGEVALDELVEVGKKHSLMVLDDIGSGCFIDTTKYGLLREPLVQESISSGVSLTFFSGDKLLGGPQAGIIAGKKQLIDKMEKHPLARALRIDKVRLSGLAATLLHYLKGDAVNKIPVWQMISAKPDDLRKRAEKWAASCSSIADIVQGESEVGGGSLPGSTLPTWLVSLKPGVRTHKTGVQDISAVLRNMDIPIIGRIEKDILLLDPRTVPVEDEPYIISALTQLAENIAGAKLTSRRPK